MEGFFDIKETRAIFGSEDFDVGGGVEGVVGLQELFGEVGFFWVTDQLLQKILKQP